MIVATCQACGDTHHLGERDRAPCTTTCPVCSAKPYRTASNGTIDRSETARIRDAVCDVDGVGKQSLAALQSAFQTLRALKSASVADLTAVDYVGQQTAANIIDAT